MLVADGNQGARKPDKRATKRMEKMNLRLVFDTITLSNL